jgi:hypothetical protein
MDTWVSVINNNTVIFQIHGYKSGHQLLFNTKELSRDDQDTVDRLSDISGSLRPGEMFDPYFTSYPLPSKKYYVVARTWQDLTAARAGCVITKSLIIDQGLWMSSENVFAFFDILIGMSSDSNIRVSKIHLKDTQVPIVNSPYLDEVVEAIFINKRQPIVVFDSKEPLFTAVRILTVQWPALRNKFAVCTYALSQRTIEGRPFDLLFAPGNTRSKFSSWPGRFIEPSLSLKEQKVTRLISASIFESKNPTLLQPKDSIFFSEYIEMNDETFRLSLLWNDLTAKLRVNNSSLAILGLLDIANILPEPAAVPLYNSIRNKIIDAITIVPESLSTEDSLSFIISLLAKHKRKLLDRELFHLVRKCVNRISQKDTLGAINFIQNYSHPTNRLFSSIYAGIADGISISFRSSEGRRDIKYLTNPEIGLKLISTSQEFAEIALYNYEQNLVDWIHFVQMILRVDNEDIKSRAVKNLTLCFSKNTQPELLDIILVGSTEKIFKGAINQFTLSNMFSSEKLVDTILENSARLALIDYLLDLLFYLGRQEFTEFLVCRLLFRQPKLFNKLLRDERLNIEIAASIINKVYNDPGQEFIDLIKNSKDESTYLINSSVSEMLSSIATANILIYANIPLEEALTRLNALPTDVINSANSYGINMLLAKLLKQLDPSFDAMLGKVLSKLKKINVNYIYEAAIHHQNSRLRIIGNLEILLKPDLPFQNKLIENVDYISRLLEANLTSDTSSIIEIGWTRILRHSSKHKESQKQAAVYMLKYAYNISKRDPTMLIEASFPIIYKAFLKGKSIAAAFNYFLFQDWDRCRTLREELVETYLKKKWSKFGLLCVAHSTGILKEVVKIIHNRKDGKKILEEAISQGQQSPRRNQMLKAIANLKE